MCIILTMGLLSLFFLPKAAVEVLYFHDKPAAKQTMKSWLVMLLSLGMALYLTLASNNS